MIRSWTPSPTPNMRSSMMVIRCGVALNATKCSPCSATVPYGTLRRKMASLPLVEAHLGWAAQSVEIAGIGPGPEGQRPFDATTGAVILTLAIPRAQIAMAWLLHKPGITAPIVGPSKPGHLCSDRYSTRTISGA